MHNFTKELCAFTNLPQPLPQSYFLSLPSALSDPRPFPPSLTHILGAQDHKPPESSMLFHFFLLQLFLQLLLPLFVKLLVIFQGSHQEACPLNFSY